MPRKPRDTNASALRALAEGLRHASENPNIYGYSPHPKQIDFHSSQARIRQFIGGNRSGKTVGGAVESIWWLTGEHPYRKTPPPPVRGRCCSVDFVNGVEKIVRPEIKKWLPPSALLGGSWSSAYSKELRTLTLENGSTLEFMSYDQDLDKFAGTSRHFVWHDEEPPQDIWNENLLRTLDVRGDMWVTMTPVEGMTWTYDEIFLKSEVSPRYFTVEVASDENPYISADEIVELFEDLDDDEKKARLKGQYVSLGGLIYKDFGDKNIIDPFSPPKEWLKFCAMDHGFNNPTAWLWFAVNKDGDIFVYDEHYVSGEIVKYHAQRVLEKNSELGITPVYNVGDPSIRNSDPITGTSVQIEYIENGVPLILGNNDVKAGLNRVSGLLRGVTLSDGSGTRPQLYITRNCVNLIRELRRLRWQTWANKKMQRQRNPKEEQHKKDDHACDALRYGIMSRPQIEDGSSVPEFVPPVDLEYSVASPVNAHTTGKDLVSPRKQTQWKYSEGYDPEMGTEW